MKNRILAMFMAAAVVGTTVLPGMTVDAAKQGKSLNRFVLDAIEVQMKHKTD